MSGARKKCRGSLQRINVHIVLIDVFGCDPLTFTSHHGSGFKALLAGTLKASHYIGAGSISTRVSNGALIRVWRNQNTKYTKHTKRKYMDC